MKYHINKTNYSNFSIYEKNKLPARSYFIPYPDRQSADAVTTLEKRYSSPKVTCLNGDWDFRFYPLPAELPDELDTEKTDFDTIDVPSCWQFRGYAKPFYVNIRYQFPYRPPVIPTEKKAGPVFSWIGVDQKISPRIKCPGEEYNYVGVYRRTFTIENPQKNYILSFLGVASCLDLYLNGEFVGYSEGSHNTAEFDLTGKVHAGENELLAVVHRWCNGTYLEGQDMFRNNGIFRDVLLRESDPSDPWDIKMTTRKNQDGTYNLSLEAELIGKQDTEITFSLRGHGLDLQKTVSTQNGRAATVFHNLSVTEWNAEYPTLYDVYFETAASCVKERCGFRTVTIDGDIFLVNGRRIKLHGVNHHDTSAKNGYYETPELILKDIETCKNFNIDTIRTSHYPPDPLLLELADEKGIYIVDENDLETHGTFAHQFPPTYNSISNNPKWQPRYIDRITRLYERDRNHACIVMWSLGNEAGGHRNMDAEYAFLKAHSDLPVHYESAVHCRTQAYDVGSEMYPTPAMVHDVGEKKRRMKKLNDRPYFMCEYAHAMGVGPGDIEKYWQEIYRYDSLFGGCVWEMVDHAVLEKDGTYTYGGDHGEWEHDGNFCVDGMFYPDRSPSTGAWIMRFIYRPVRVRMTGKDTIEIFNTTAFSEGSRYRVDIRWNDGTGETITPKAEPLSRETRQISAGKPADGSRLAVAVVTDTATGKEVSREQLVLEENVPPAPTTCPLPESVRVEGGQLYISGELQSAPEPTLLYRAHTDNDTDAMFRNTMKPYEDQKIEFLSQKAVPNGYEVTSRIHAGMNRFIVTDRYEGTEDGGILVTSTLHCERGHGYVPRFGKSFRLDSSFDKVDYFGRAGESYNDMKEQFTVGEVHCRVKDMTEPNIRPQESGNRCDCTHVRVSSDSASATFTAAGKPFELGIKPYTDRALISMRHRGDEKRTGTYVTIEAFQEGIGTGACGPVTAPEYKYSVKRDYQLQFLIRIGEAK